MSIKLYSQEIYDQYLGQEVDPKAFIQSVDRQVIYRHFQGWWGDVLPKDKTEPILDLGCGWGSFLAFLKSQGYTNLAGVDSSAQQVKIAHCLDLAQVEVGDIFTVLNKYRNRFACISAFNVLEHLEKEQVLPFLKAVQTALKPGGCLLLEIPNANSPFGGRTRYWDFTHELSFTPTSLGQILRVAGFADVQFRERSPVVHGTKSWIRSRLWQFLRQVIGFYLLVEQGSAGYKIFTQDMHAIAFK